MTSADPPWWWKPWLRRPADATYQAGPWNQTRGRRRLNRAIHGHPCRCGHGKPWHLHYRGNSDCAADSCACGRYRRDWSRRARR